MFEGENMTDNSIEIKSDVEHARDRVQMYAGSKTLSTQEEYTFDAGKLVKVPLTYTPALVKVISEINIEKIVKRNG